MVETAPPSELARIVARFDRLSGVSSKSVSTLGTHGEVPATHLSWVIPPEMHGRFFAEIASPDSRENWQVSREEFERTTESISLCVISSDLLPFLTVFACVRLSVASEGAQDIVHETHRLSVPLRNYIGTMATGRRSGMFPFSSAVYEFWQRLSQPEIVASRTAFLKQAREPESRIFRDGVAGLPAGIAGTRWALVSRVCIAENWDLLLTTANPLFLDRDSPAIIHLTDQSAAFDFFELPPLTIPPSAEALTLPDSSLAFSLAIRCWAADAEHAARQFGQEEARQRRARRIRRSPEKGVLELGETLDDLSRWEHDLSIVLHLSEDRFRSLGAAPQLFYEGVLRDSFVEPKPDPQGFLARYSTDTLEKFGRIQKELATIRGGVEKEFDYQAALVAARSSKVVTRLTWVTIALAIASVVLTAVQVCLAIRR